MNNSTELTNVTGNGTFYKPFDVENLPDIGKIFADGSKLVSEILTSWGFVPEEIYFRIIVLMFAVIILYQIFVSGSSKLGSGFKWILTIFIVLVILVGLGVV